MRYNDIFAGAVVKEGYTMLALVSDGDLFHAIIRREKMGDFVYCYAYDIKDGSWGQGHYCKIYAEAANELAHHIGMM